MYELIFLPYLCQSFFYWCLRYFLDSISLFQFLSRCHKRACSQRYQSILQGRKSHSSQQCFFFTSLCGHKTMEWFVLVVYICWKVCASFVKNSCFICGGLENINKLFCLAGPWPWPSPAVFIPTGLSSQMFDSITVVWYSSLSVSQSDRLEMWQLWQCDSVTVWQLWQCDSVTTDSCDSVTEWQCDSVTVVPVWQLWPLTVWQDSCWLS